MHTIKQFFAIALLSIFSSHASALVIEQAPLDGGDGSFSVGPSGVQIAADDFQFSGDVLLTNISWWGSYDPIAPANESFTVRVFVDNGFGSPEVNALFENSFSGSGDNSDGLFDLFGGEVFRYDKSVSWSLTGGEDYYLSVFNNDSNQDWFWLESSSGSGEGWSRSLDGDAWINDPNTLNMSFRLTADPVATNVPEPATLLLMLLPLLWFGRKAIKKSPMQC